MAVGFRGFRRKAQHLFSDRTHHNNPRIPREQLAQRDTLTLDPEAPPPSVTSPDENPEDTVPNVDSNNHEGEIPPPNSPRKSKYNLRANPPANWKKDYAYYNPMNFDPTHKTQYLIIRKDHRPSY